MIESVIALLIIVIEFSIPIVPCVGTLIFAVRMRRRHPKESQRLRRLTKLEVASEIVFWTGAVAATTLSASIFVWGASHHHGDGIGDGLLVLVGTPIAFVIAFTLFWGMAAFLNKLSENLTYD